MRYQVNFEKLYIDGACKGRRYHSHERFKTRADAIFFAKRDGSLVSVPELGTYRQEASQIIDLSKFD